MGILSDDIVLTSEEAKEFRESENQSKSFSLKIFSIIGMSLTLLYCLLYALLGNLVGSSIALALAGVFLAVFLVTRYTISTSAPAYILSIIIGILLLGLFATGGVTGYDALWYYVYPALTLFVLGHRLGSILSMSLVALTFALSLIDTVPVLTGFYSTDFKVIFLLSYIGVFSLSYTYEYIRDQTRKKLVKSMIDAQKAEQSMTAKTELMVDLSHQIRTPLSSIMGITNLMEQENVSAGVRDFIDAINTSVINVSMVLNNMMNVSELRAESENENALCFDVKEITSKTIASCAERLGKAEFKSAVHISEYIPPRLTGNARKIELILDNILTIIIEHSRKNEVAFDVYVSDKKETANAIELLFEIHSSSVKTDAEDVEERIDYAAQDGLAGNQERTGSTHMENYDLDVAKKMVESFGGSIGFKKPDGAISVFWFTVLLWKTREKVRTPHEPSTREAYPGGNISEASVLMVEDNMMNQKVLTLALRPKVKNLEIANNGREALKLMETLKFDIILMDLQMPVLDGYKTTMKIKELEVGTNIHTPIIALTANAMQGEREKCLSYGMDDYISKPFNLETLLEKIEYHLGRSNKKAN